MALKFIPLIVIFVLLLGFVGYRYFSRSKVELELPKVGETKKEMIVIENGEVVDRIAEEKAAEQLAEQKVEEKRPAEKAPVDRIIKEIMITDGVRHSIPLEEINTLLSADGIPPIDNPKFVSIAEADKFIKDSEPGIAFSLASTQRFYPYQILTWHEIVNDTVDGQRVLIAYCPLCLTGYALDPLVKGERVEFGTSGKLWKSNLVMYDRKTNSLWSQVLAEAIVGEMTGTRLKLLTSDQVRYGEWKKTHPKGEVLSKDTGHFRNYGSYPYAGGDYFGVDNISLQLAKPSDTRLPNNAFVFGVVANGKAKAYDAEAIKTKGEVIDNFEGEEFLLKHNKDLDVVQIFRRLPDSTWERFNPISGFWFSWATAHPETELYK